MINNYSYDANSAVPHSDTSFSSTVGAKKYNYNEIYAKGLTEATYTKDNRNTQHKSKVSDIFRVTMGQAHHFTFKIDRLMVNNSITHSTYGKFLPIKTITYKPVAIESTKLNFGIFADFPIIHKRKMGSVQVTLLDTCHNDYEQAVFEWFDTCHDTGSGFVAPLAEIIQPAEYMEYTNNGKRSKKYTFEVIPDGDVSISRSYENASLKEITFNTIIVSPIYLLDEEKLQYGMTTSASIVGEGARYIQ